MRPELLSYSLDTKKSKNDMMTIFRGDPVLNLTYADDGTTTVDENGHFRDHFGGNRR